MSTPGNQTTHYGWSIWHLTMAEKAHNTEGAMVHTTAAQARATLALVDMTQAVHNDGHCQFDGSLWQEEEAPASDEQQGPTLQDMLTETYHRYSPESVERALAAEQDRIAARALREAAGLTEQIDGRRDDAAASWLRTRADEIERKG